MCISCLCLLLMNYYLMIYIILGYGNDIRQKANSSDFLIQVSMAHKAVETTCNINNPFGPRTANERTVK